MKTNSSATTSNSNSKISRNICPPTVVIAHCQELLIIVSNTPTTLRCTVMKTSTPLSQPPPRDGIREAVPHQVVRQTARCSARGFHVHKVASRPPMGHEDSASTMTTVPITTAPMTTVTTVTFSSVTFTNATIREGGSHSDHETTATFRLKHKKTELPMPYHKPRPRH